MLVYTSDELDRDLEVIGPVEMVLYAASSAKDTDFIVRLCDVHPDGKLDLRHRGHPPRALPQLERGRLDRAARAGRGRRVPDPLLPDGERLQGGPPAAARRDELELPALLAQPEHRRGRRHGHADGGRAADGAAHGAYPSHVVLPVVPAMSDALRPDRPDRAGHRARRAGSGSRSRGARRRRRARRDQRPHGARPCEARAARDRRRGRGAVRRHRRGRGRRRRRRARAGRRARQQRGHDAARAARASSRSTSGARCST